MMQDALAPDARNHQVARKASPRSFSGARIGAKRATRLAYHLLRSPTTTPNVWRAHNRSPGPPYAVRGLQHATRKTL